MVLGRIQQHHDGHPYATTPLRPYTCSITYPETKVKITLHNKHKKPHKKPLFAERLYKTPPLCRVPMVLTLLTQVGTRRWFSLANWLPLEHLNVSSHFSKCWLKTPYRHHAHSRVLRYNTTFPTVGNQISGMRPIICPTLSDFRRSGNNPKRRHSEAR